MKEERKWWHDPDRSSISMADFMEYRQACIEDDDFSERHLGWVSQERSWPYGNIKGDWGKPSRHFRENEARYRTYENVDTHPSDIAIFIPISIDEPIENVARTLELLKLQCEDGEFYADVFLCLNYKYPFTLKQLAEIGRSDAIYQQENVNLMIKYAAYFEPLDELMDNYVAGSTHPLRLQLMSGSFAADENFNAIRSWYMLEYLLDYAITREVPQECAAMWLDADTPRIGKGAIRQGIDAVNDETAHYVKLFLQLVSDGTSDPAFTKRDEPELVAALYALLRRMVEDNLDPTDERGYPDECGLIMPLDKYYKIGGVANKHKEVGESRGLLQRAKRKLDPSIPLLAVLPKARLYNDYRRQTRLAALGKPIDIPKGEDGDDYQSDTEMRGRIADEAKEELALGDIVNMFAYMVKRQRRYNQEGGIDRAVLSEDQIRRFAAVVLRFFPTFGKNPENPKKDITMLAAELERTAGN